MSLPAVIAVGYGRRQARIGGAVPAQVPVVPSIPYRYNGISCHHRCSLSELVSRSQSPPDICSVYRCVRCSPLYLSIITVSSCGKKMQWVNVIAIKYSC
jgi:hypothetical protein